MLDINTIEKLDRVATPFYYYDMELFGRTVDHVARLAQEHDIKVHYAVKANVERRLLEDSSSKGFGADCVIEAVGAPVTYVTAINAVSFTGRVVCIGYAKNPVEFETKFFVQKELDIRGSRNANPSDFRAVQRYFDKNDVPMERFISGIATPETALEAMEKWAADPAQVFRLLVKF